MSYFPLDAVWEIMQWIMITFFGIEWSRKRLK